MWFTENVFVAAIKSFTAVATTIVISVSQLNICLLAIFLGIHALQKDSATTYRYLLLQLAFFPYSVFHPVRDRLIRAR